MEVKVKELVRLEMIKLKAEIKIEAYQLSINMLQSENVLHDDLPDYLAINNKWIEKYQDRIEILTEILKEA